MPWIKYYNKIIRTNSILVIFSLFILGVLLLSSCKKADEAPMGPTDFIIDLENAQNIKLKTSGGWEYYTGGYNGVVIFNNNWEFIAFERACPIDHGCQVEVDDSGVTLTCPCCGSRFIYTDGTPFEGKAKSPLRQYIAMYDGIRYVYVRSY